MIRNIPDIRKNFTPLQPFAGQYGEGVCYNELFPHHDLSGLIYCYWELKTIAPLKTLFQYKVVADACTDIFFETENPEQLFVMGFSTGYTEFPLGYRFRYMGIRFLPSVFPLLFRVDGQELAGKVTALGDVLPGIFKSLVQYMPETASFTEYAGFFDARFREITTGLMPAIDGRFFNALDIILRKRGGLRLQDELDTGISPRQLRRLFGFYMGSTPKAFSKVVRFQYGLQTGLARSVGEGPMFFYDAGYYDQSHFIREFRQMYGCTPADVMKEK